MHYYQHDLALVHDRGYGQHADRCAPGILEMLAPVRGGLVLELGCGSGALTRHLLAAGFPVIATDASDDMLSLARAALGEQADLRRLTLPGDPLPAADAIVSVGHVISYLPDAAAVDQALINMAGALRPGGVLAIDILRPGVRPDPGGDGDHRPGLRVRTGLGRHHRVLHAGPGPVRPRHHHVRPRRAGAWRRGRERHENVLVDTSLIPARLAGHGVQATVGSAFGHAELPPGLRAVTGRKSISLSRARPGGA